jgi:hypothetical protein
MDRDGRQTARHRWEDAHVGPQLVETGYRQIKQLAA